MSKLKVYLYNNTRILDDPIEEDFLFETDKEIELGEPFIKDGVYYSPSCRIPKQGIIIVHKISKPLDEDDADDLIECEITCPYCKNSIESFEMGDGEDEAFCETCGSTYSWYREITVDYRSSPVEKYEIKEL